MNPQNPSNNSPESERPDTVIRPYGTPKQPVSPTASLQGMPTPAQPQPAGSPSQSPAGGNEPHKKLLFIIGVMIAALLVVTAVVVAITKHKSGKTADNTSTNIESDLYHSRAGYDIKQYGPEIGDPQALTMNKFDKVMNTAKGPVVYACNVVSMYDLNTLKTNLAARSDDQAVQRTFIDNVGQKTPEMNTYTLPTPDDDNLCMYSIRSGGLFEVHVYQAAFVDPGATQNTLNRRYSKVSDVGGLPTYKSKDASSTRSSYIVVSGNDSIELLFNGTKLPEAKQQELLALAAKNFVDQHATAKGAAIPSYETPTYKKSWARACDLISNADIKSLTGSDASIYAKEGLASGTGIYKVGDKLYNGITTSCDRYNAGIGSGIGAGPFDQELEVRVTSFNSDVPAKAYIASAAKDYASSKVSASIGDEGIAFPDNAGQNTLVFRQGRFTVDVMYDRTLQKKAGLGDTNAMVQKLTPYAQSVVTKLKSLQ